MSERHFPLSAAFYAGERGPGGEVLTDTSITNQSKFLRRDWFVETGLSRFVSLPPIQQHAKNHQ